MTVIISRYFAETSQAMAARKELIQIHRLSAGIILFFDEADGLADALTDAEVNTDAARAYQNKVASGGAVLLVKAGFKPLGVARITRKVTAEAGAVALVGQVEEVTIKDPPAPISSVMTDHPHMLTRARDPYNTNFHMADWPIPLISRRKASNTSIFPRHARMANFPIPLLVDRKPYTGSIFAPHARMANFPLPLISKRKPFTGSIFGRHARMANFPLPLISRRKPYTGSIIARHARMANFPFPHLINGKTGTNSLMPGAPRMANFPIPLISRRVPKSPSIFSRHARMANFPLPLISRRKPKNRSIFPRHARMANVFLPLVIEHGPLDAKRGAMAFSLSKTFGIPTLSKR